MKKLYLYFSAAVVMLFSGLSTEMSFLSADQDLMQLKCTKCHALKVPDNYTKEEWKFNVERMAQRSGLTDKEIQIILDLNTKK